MKKEIKKAMGVSPVTGRIYYGNLRGDEWIGGKEDVTETAVRAVYGKPETAGTCRSVKTAGG